MADQGQADDLFRAAGHSLENVQGQAFVCRVDGLPTAEEESCTRTPPSDAYWGLWWSDGTDGTWTYSSQGTYALDVPDGGAVAFSWNGSSGAGKPGVTPPKHAQPSSPEPTKSTSGGKKGGGTTSGGPTGSAGTPSASPDGSPTASAAAEARRERAAKRGRDEEVRGKKADKKGREQEVEPTDEPSASPTEESEAAVVAEPPADTDGGLPVWVGPTGAAGALAVAGLAAYLRRRAA